MGASQVKCAGYTEDVMQDLDLDGRMNTSPQKTNQDEVDTPRILMISCKTLFWRWRIDRPAALVKMKRGFGVQQQLQDDTAQSRQPYVGAPGQHGSGSW
jgi:hypothetical protein